MKKLIPFLFIICSPSVFAEEVTRIFIGNLILEARTYSVNPSDIHQNKCQKQIATYDNAEGGTYTEDTGLVCVVQKLNAEKTDLLVNKIRSAVAEVRFGKKMKSKLKIEINPTVSGYTLKVLETNAGYDYEKIGEGITLAISQMANPFVTAAVQTLAR